MKTTALVSALCLLLLTSCKKDKNDSSCDKTMSAIAGTYMVVKLEVGLSGSFQDITDQLDDCEKDDKLILNANGVTDYQDVGSVCSPSGSDTGTWNINSSGKMTIDDNGSGSTDIQSADITSFDCSTLVLTGTDPSVPGVEFRLTIKK
jgi:hypothetical protein